MNNDNESMTLVQALQEWGKYEEDADGYRPKHEMITWGENNNDDISIWYEHGIMYESYSCFAMYKAFHAGIPTIRDPVFNHPQRTPMEEERLEVLLAKLAEIYSDLWTRTDWSVEERYAR